MAVQLSDAAVERIVSSVIERLGAPKSCSCNGSKSAPVGGAPLSNGKYGVFDDAGEAAAAAAQAYEKLRATGVAGRDKVVQIVKGMCTANAEAWGKLELDETKIGRLDHKIQKLQGIQHVPGVEWLHPYGMSGDHGITMEEAAPWGVIGAITPVTHSIPTISCNIVNMVAAGNTLVVNPHPGGARCATHAVSEFNQAIERELGIANIVTIVREPTLESFDAICHSADVGLLCVTGGPGVVDAAMQSGKRAICAGPGNPPVVVDEYARLDKAARDIIFGASYDNNLLCIGEKQVFVVDKVYSAFVREFEKAGAVKLNGSQLKTLTEKAFTIEGNGGGCSHAVLNRDLIGADPTVLAQHAGTTVPAGTELLFAETDADHPFVVEEQMMPMIPVVRVKNFQEAVREASRSEHGYKHSAMIHSLNVERMTEMVQKLDSTLFIKNGSCLTGLGNQGEGYASFSIATTTGEGITTPTTFTRRRRCVLVDNLRSIG